MRRNLLTFFAALLLCSVSYAQELKVGITNFKAGVGVTQQDIDGVSAIFTTYFINPAEYTLVERTQINKLIEEQNLQQSTITDTDMIRIGQIMNLTYIIVGDINLVMGEYNIDVRLINVENGNIVSTDGSSWMPGQSYRAVMQKIAENLKLKIQKPKVATANEIREYINLFTRGYENNLMDAALSSAFKIHELCPEHHATYFWLGYIYFLKREFQKAIQLLETALLRYNPEKAFYFNEICGSPSLFDGITDTPILSTIAKCYLSIKDYEKAYFYQNKLYSYYSKMIDENPENIFSVDMDDILLYTHCLQMTNKASEGVEICNYLLKNIYRIKQQIDNGEFNQTELTPELISEANNLITHLLMNIYSQLSFLYGRIHHDSILPQDPNLWHNEYKEALRNAAKYGDKQSQQTCQAVGLSY